MRAIAVILSLWTVSALADELPTSLLLKCEGKVSTIFTGNGSLSKDDKFEALLRLKDGELSEVDSSWMTTKNCSLQNGIVHCSAKSIVPIDGGSERRELESFIRRETGEYHFFLQTWDFEGPNASGRQVGNMKLSRAGICRQVSKPIF
jgi:hypothetical protein